MARDGIEPSTFRFSEGSATVNWVFLVLQSHTQFVGVSVWSLMGLCGVVESCAHSVHMKLSETCGEGGLVRALLLCLFHDCILLVLKEPALLCRSHEFIP